MTNTASAGFNIAAVERDTGLSKDVLRVWERRYGFPAPERDQDDFILKQEVVALLEHLAQMGSGKVCLLEIKHGLPFLMRIEERAA